VTVDRGLDGDRRGVPPSWRRVSAVLACDAERAWGLLTDTEVWPRWGPTVRSARLDGPFTDGTTGTVTTVLGVRLPVVLRDVVPGVRWSWDVAGVRATSHHVVPLDVDRTEVAFGVPAAALPYLAVCRAALGQLQRLA
jgi:hypothetical protein